MDSVHDPDDRISISEPIHVGEFKRTWIGLTKNNINHEETLRPKGELDELCRRMNLTADEVQSIALDCSVDNLDSVSTESEQVEGHNSSSKTLPNLVTLKVLNQIDQQCQESTSFQQRMKLTSKYRFFEPRLRTNYNTKKSEAASGPLLGDDVLLLINVYQPYRKHTDCKNMCLKVEQEIVVLGVQTLVQLRDCITCLGDLSVPGEDYSLTPDISPDTPARDVWPSGFFYINGTFYNDMRNPASRDYSKTITDWASQNPEIGIGPFQSKKMEEIKFEELELRLGYPYVYQHLGNCEHLLVFRDVRMISPEDCQFLEKYPLIQGISKRRRIVCMVCNKMTATWVTTGNNRLTHDPFFFCDTCFRSFNYTKDNQKIGEFRAHPFIDRSSLL